MRKGRIVPVSEVEKAQKKATEAKNKLDLQNAITSVLTHDWQAHRDVHLALNKILDRDLEYITLSDALARYSDTVNRIEFKREKAGAYSSQEKIYIRLKGVN
ncbi:MAG: hypothetical protein FWC80_01350 [Firmicutes bacterium]|nr:hypothetical protein [Bacillota bacterium]